MRRVWWAWTVGVVLLSGCAFRVEGWPPRAEGLLLYGRATDTCGVGEIPAPLPPEGVAQATHAVAATCSTLEVGSKSYQDSISAIGVVLGSLIAAGVLF